MEISSAFEQIIGSPIQESNSVNKYTKTYENFDEFYFKKCYKRCF